VTPEDQLELLEEIIRRSKSQKFLRMPTSSPSDITNTAKIFRGELLNPYLDLIEERFL